MNNKQLSLPVGLRDPLNFSDTNLVLQESVIEAFRQQPVQSYGDHTLEFSDFSYPKKRDFTLKEQKDALLSRASLGLPLRGTVTLRNKETGKPVSKKRTTVMRVPYITKRGTYVLGGSEYTLALQKRLRPGAYTRQTANKEYETFIKTKGGTGFNLVMDPTSGELAFKIYNSKTPMYTVMRGLGMNDEEIKETMGEDLFKINRRSKYKNSLPKVWNKVTRGRKETDNIERDLLAEFENMELDENTTFKTLGTPYKNVSKDVFKDSVRNLLATYRGERDVDDRDAYSFQRILGPEDIFSEGILRDKAGVARNILYKAQHTKNLDHVHANVFKNIPDHVFHGSRLAMALEEINPVDAIDSNVKITGMGDGGFGSDHGVPDSARMVSPTQLGYVDLVRTPECHRKDNTEVMTISGWVPVANVTMDTELACMINDRLEFHVPERIIDEPYKGLLYTMSSQFIGYQVTPNHRMWTRGSFRRKDGSNPPYRFETADIVHKKSQRSHLSGGHLPSLGSGEEYKIVGDQKIHMDTWCAFMGWYISEGCSRHSYTKEQSHRYITRISQAYPEGVKRILDILEAMDFSWSYSGPDRSFSICGKHLYEEVSPIGLCNSKYIPEELFTAPISARKLLLSELIEGDGRVGGNGKSPYYTTTSKQLADDVQRLAFGLGICASISCYPDNREERYLDVYEVCLQVKTVRVTRKEYSSTYEYDGNVWCATVPGGLLYTRCGVRSGLWSGNSGNVGIDSRLSINTFKGADGNLYSQFIGKDGKPEYVSSSRLDDLVIAFPGDIEKVGTGKQPKVRAVNKGIIDYVDPSEVDYTLPAGQEMFSLSTNLIPYVSGVKGMRAMMGAKYVSQALSLQKREAPRVQSLAEDGQSFHRIAAEKVGAVWTKGSGQVLDVTKDSMKVQYDDGSVEDMELYNDFPMNRKSLLRQTSLLKPGERFEKNQPIIDSNYTAGGELALGTHLRVAYMDMKGMSHEDAGLISESAAKKLSSEHLYTKKLDLDSSTSTDLGKFMSIFSGKYTKDQLSKLSNAGVVRVGSVLEKDDPVIINMKKRSHKGLGMVSSGSKSSQWKDNTLTWDHTHDGIVTDVWHDRSGVKVAIKSIASMNQGDKLCFTDDHDLYTTNRGWQPVAEIEESDTMICLDLSKLTLEESKVAKVNGYRHHGPIFSVDRPEVSMRVTLKHNLVASWDGAHFGLYSAEELLKSEIFWVLAGANMDPILISVEDDVVVDDYDGWVYCPTLEEHNTLLTRHNGLVHWSGNSGTFGNKSIVSCFPPDTYVYCDTGWKQWDTVTPDDKLACLQDGTSSFETPTALISAPYSGEMIHAKSARTLEYCVTPNHEMYVRKENSDRFHKEKAEDGYKKRRSHISKIPEFDRNIISTEYTDLIDIYGDSYINQKKHPTRFKTSDLLEFLGWFISEGYLTKQSCGNKQVCISQCIEKNPEKTRRIHSLLDRMGLTFSYRAKGLIFTIYNNPLYFALYDSRGSANKYIPEWVFSDIGTPELKILFSALMAGDGYISPKGCIEYGSISKQLATDFDRLATLLGYNTKITGCVLSGVRKRGHYKFYRVRSSLGRDLIQRDGKTEFCKVPNKSGVVYCAEVPGNLLLVRHGSGRPMWTGNSILPDDQMPIGEDGQPLEYLVNPFGTIGRHNPSQIVEAQLAKVARHTGKNYVLPAFSDGEAMEMVQEELDKAGLKATESITLPEGRTVHNVMTGDGYYLKLHHMSEDKRSEVGEGAFNLGSVPTSGPDEDKPKRVGSLEMEALLAHGAPAVIRDAKLVRGQENREYFKDLMDGKNPRMPTVSPVYKRFIATLQSSGIRITPTDDRTALKLSAMTDKDVLEKSNGEITEGATIKWKSRYGKNLRGEADMNPVDNGLFDRGITGGMGGTNFSHISLPARLPQPVFEKQIRAILGVTEKQLHQVITGQHSLGDFGSGPQGLERALGSLNVDNKIEELTALYKDATKPSIKDKLAKQLRAFKGLQGQGITPKQLLTSKVLVLPPIFRPVSVTSDFEIIADANLLYKDLLDAKKNYLDLEGVVGEEMRSEGLLSVYKAYKAVTGLGQPIKRDRVEKKIKGLLSDVFGPNGNKTSLVQRNLTGTPTAYSARGVIVPDPTLTLDEVGLPWDQAWTLFSPFVVKRLIAGTDGSSTAKKKVMKDIENRSDNAKQALLAEMKERPVMYSRAPVLHKYGVLAGFGVPVTGNAIRTNIPTMVGLGADFDGDTLQIHAIVTPDAVKEAKAKMLPSKHLFSVSDFRLMHTPEHGFNMGIYNLGGSAGKRGKLISTRSFKNYEELMAAYSRGDISLEDEVVIEEE